MGNVPESIVSDDDEPVSESPSAAPATRPYRPRLLRESSVATLIPYLELGDPRHGSMNGYVNFKCRCPDCGEANRAYATTRRAARKAAQSVAS